MSNTVMGFSLFFGGLIFILIWVGYYFLGKRLEKQESMKKKYG